MYMLKKLCSWAEAGTIPLQNISAVIDWLQQCTYKLYKEYFSYSWSGLLFSRIVVLLYIDSRGVMVQKKMLVQISNIYSSVLNSEWVHFN